MNEHLRERILRKIESLSDERGYQVLDYVEFLESKFAVRQTPTGNAFTRFTEAVEDRMRAGRISASAIAETMSLLNRAANVLNGAVAAGKSVATDLVSAAQNATVRPPSPPGGASAASATPATPATLATLSTPAATTTSVSQPVAAPVSPTEASSPARDIQQPGSGEERL